MSLLHLTNCRPSLLPVFMIASAPTALYAFSFSIIESHLFNVVMS